MPTSQPKDLKNKVLDLQGKTGKLEREIEHAEAAANNLLSWLGGAKKEIVEIRKAATEIREHKNVKDKDE